MDIGYNVITLKVTVSLTDMTNSLVTSLEETPHIFKQVVMEEYYTKEYGKVFWHWRMEGGNWNTQETPYKEIPWVEYQTFNQGIAQ